MLRGSLGGSPWAGGVYGFWDRIPWMLRGSLGDLWVLGGSLIPGVCWGMGVGHWVLVPPHTFRSTGCFGPPSPPWVGLEGSCPLGVGACWGVLGNPLRFWDAGGRGLHRAAAGGCVPVLAARPPSHPVPQGSAAGPAPAGPRGGGHLNGDPLNPCTETHSLGPLYQDPHPGALS